MVLLGRSVEGLWVLDSETRAMGGIPPGHLHPQRDGEWPSSGNCSKERPGGVPRVRVPLRTMSRTLSGGFHFHPRFWIRGGEREHTRQNVPVMEPPPQTRPDQQPGHQNSVPLAHACKGSCRREQSSGYQDLLDGHIGTIGLVRKEILSTRFTMVMPKDNGIRLALAIPFSTDEDDCRCGLVGS